MTESYDVVIIGAGHNGLVCACYLAAAGLKVKVLERRSVVGGAAVTEEFHPGFRNSVASYTVSLLNPKVIRDLDLPRHGLRIVERRLANFLPLPDGQLPQDRRGRDALPRSPSFSPRDAERYDAYAAELDAIADVLRDLVLQHAAQSRGRRLARGSAGRLAELGTGNRLRRLSMAQRRALLDLFTKSAGDYLDGWFESDSDQGRLRLRRHRRQLTPAPTRPAPPMSCCTTSSAR